MDDRDRAILAFEETHTRHHGTKEQAIRANFDMPAGRYYQRLGMILDDPDALREQPVVVRRLQRARDAARLVRRHRLAAADPRV